jgi:hypothetical protein
VSHHTKCSGNSMVEALSFELGAHKRSTFSRSFNFQAFEIDQKTQGNLESSRCFQTTSTSPPKNRLGIQNAAKLSAPMKMTEGNLGNTFAGSMVDTWKLNTQYKILIRQSLKIFLEDIEDTLVIQMEHTFQMDRLSTMCFFLHLLFLYCSSNKKFH